MADIDNRISLLAVADKYLDDRYDRLDKASLPLWEGQVEFGKSLATLASGALILSISVAQALASRNTHTAWTWLLPAAWLAFGISIILAVGHQTWLGAVRTERLVFERGRDALRGEILRLDPAAVNIEALLSKLLSDAIEAAGKATEAHGAIYHKRALTMFYSFSLGLMGLVVFAIRNLSF